MLQKDLPYYVYRFTHLRRDSKKGGAPHKPVLLLSIIEMFERGIFSTPEIYVIPELVASFKTIWTELVTTEHLQNFSLPFFHMRSEPFWSLIPNTGCESWLKSGSSIHGLRNLLLSVSHALIDSDLASILLNDITRDVLRISLLERYFLETKHCFNSSVKERDYTTWLESSSEEYKREIFELQNNMNENLFQEEVFIRGGVFKREIPKIYNQTCAISGLRIDSLTNTSMVDACHIVPFSEGYDDTLSNGIALCPNIHRAFDRGLLSISDSYKVLINDNFIENLDSVMNISQFRGKELNMPILNKHVPSQLNIARHRKKHGFL